MKLLVFLWLIRIESTAAYLLSILAGAHLVGETFRTPSVQCSLIAFFFCVSASFALSDYFDRKADAINLPYRPIPSGRVSARFARGYGVVAFTLGVLTSLFLGTTGFVYVTLVSLAAIVYSPYIKRVPVLKNAYIVLLSLAPFMYPAVAANNVGRSALLCLVVAPGLLAREVIMDMRDIDGDRLVGVRTLPYWLGLTRSRIVVGAIFVCNACCASAIYHLVALGARTPLGIRLLDVCLGMSALMVWGNRKPSKTFLTIIIHLVLGGVVAAIISVV